MIVDAAAINSIDVTAADRLEMMAENFDKERDQVLHYRAFRKCE